MPISPRRLLRWALVLVAMTFAVIACWHDTAYAGRDSLAAVLAAG